MVSFAFLYIVCISIVVVCVFLVSNLLVSVVQVRRGAVQRQWVSAVLDKDFFQV